MFRRFAVAFGAAFIALSGVATAGQPTQISLSVTAQTSTGGVIPTNTGENWFYDYQVPTGSAIADSIPVQVCATVTRQGDATAFATTVTIQQAGGNLSTVTDPSPLSFTAEGCQTAYIGLSTDPLSSNNYNRVLHVSASTPDGVNANMDNQNIHLRATVTSGQSSTTCFFTDSSFEFLVDCGGNLVTTTTGGTFAIVTNKKTVEVATNPGQFYYNILWTNTTGADQTVAVTFARKGANAVGAQAIHAKVFPTFPAFDATQFELVNDAIPAGSMDSLASVLVPAGQTLWVDYHLEWAGLGGKFPFSGSNNTVGAGSSCGTSAPNFFVTGTVTSAGNVLQGTCGASAQGYLKP